MTTTRAYWASLLEMFCQPRECCLCKLSAKISGNKLLLAVEHRSRWRTSHKNSATMPRGVGQWGVVKYILFPAAVIKLLVHVLFLLLDLQTHLPTFTPHTALLITENNAEQLQRNSFYRVHHQKMRGESLRFQ